ncbi:Secretory carrier-associated membrane protein 5 [Geranomyces michiganensis]|nr:Secretory carrier-associated membrane protein 5 [Geranomyces michiganensis]
MAMNPFVVDDGDQSNPFASTDETRINPWGGGGGSAPPPAAATTTATASRYGGGGGGGGASSKPLAVPPATPSPAASRYKTSTTTTAPAGMDNSNNNNYNAPPQLSREMDLQRREADVAQREARLKDRERAVGTHDVPNWPKFKPMIYHDIEKEIPLRGRWLVKRVYMAWMLAITSYIINAIACFSLLVTNASSGGTTFGVSLLILLVGTPVSFVFWYRPLYNGVKNDSSAQFFFFWFNYGAHLGVAALLAVGIPGWGGAGVILTLAQFKNNVGSAILCIIASSLLIFQVVYGTWQIRSASVYFRSRGMSAQQAQEEAVTGFASSKAGRELAGTAVKTAVANEVRRT